MRSRRTPLLALRHGPTGGMRSPEALLTASKEMGRESSNPEEVNSTNDPNEQNADPTLELPEGAWYCRYLDSSPMGLGADV